MRICLLLVGERESLCVFVCEKQEGSSVLGKSELDKACFCLISFWNYVICFLIFLRSVLK